MSGIHICTYILPFNAEVIRSFFISAWSDHRKVIFEKQWIYLDNAVGHFYRTTFEIGSGGTLLLKTPKEMESSTGVCVYVPHHQANYVNIEEILTKNFTDLNSPSPPFFAAAKEAGADNRNIVDDGKSQKLTRDDIEMLKEQGLKGQVHPSPCASFMLNTMFHVQMQQRLNPVGIYFCEHQISHHNSMKVGCYYRKHLWSFF